MEVSEWRGDMGEIEYKRNIERGAALKSEYNIGLSILRAFMCFQVVLCHFWKANVPYIGWKGWLRFFRGYAVPVFMLLSFFLTEKVLVSHDKGRIIKRLHRLLVPYFCWPFIYWILYNILDWWKRGYGLECGIPELFWQLLMGHSVQLNGVMWYQFEIIILTVLFVIILYIFRERYMSVLCICMMAAWLFQYSGWNKRLFGGLRFELTYPLGRFSEMVPYAVCGFAIAHYEMYKKLKNIPGGGYFDNLSLGYLYC